MFSFSYAVKAAGRGLVLAAGVVAVPTVVFSVSGCSTSAPAGPSLYTRLGGHDAIAAVVHDFVGRAAGDPAVNFTRQGIAGAPKWDPTPDNLKILEQHLTEFVCVAAGGPETYTGRDNKTVHTGMKITDAEFTAIAKDLGLALDDFKVPQKEHDELMNAVAGTHDQIVGL